MRTKGVKAPLCACGCGQNVTKSAYSRYKKWNKYINGHRQRGCKVSEERRRNLSEDRMGSNNPAWKGGERKRSDTKRNMIYVGDGRYVLKSRLVMEEHLGRKLLDSELVHHKNEDKTDDRLENLELMSFADHTRLHHKGRKHTPEQIEKHRLAITGRKQSEETKRKRSASLKGRVVSEETRRKIGEANRKRRWS